MVHSFKNYFRNFRFRAVLDLKVCSWIFCETRNWSQRFLRQPLLEVYRQPIAFKYNNIATIRSDLINGNFNPLVPTFQNRKSSSFNGHGEARRHDRIIWLIWKCRELACLLEIVKNLNRFFAPHSISVI